MTMWPNTGEAVFQHTAARRRLVELTGQFNQALTVSTHSRPKAAGTSTVNDNVYKAVSTHSRPKAAGHTTSNSIPELSRFNTQPPEGGWI